MKNKLSTLIAVVLALVMSFALVACGGSPNPDTPPEPDGPNTPSVNDKATAAMAKKALSAVADVFDSNGVKATIQMSVSSKSGNLDYDLSVPIEKSGNRIKLEMPIIDIGGDEGDEDYIQSFADEPETQTVIINLDTGYMYAVTEIDGKLTATFIESAMPAGVFDYVTTIYDNLTSGLVIDEVSDRVSYDESSSTVSYVYDVAETVNDYTDPLYTNYKSGSLLNLLDDYLRLITDDALKFSPLKPGESGSSLIDLISGDNGFVANFEDTTLGEIFNILRDMYDIDVKQILDDNGIDVETVLDEQFGISITWDEITERTLGEVIIGAYNAAMEMFVSQQDEVPPQDGEDGDLVYDEGGMNVLLGVILNGALTGTIEEGQSAKEIVKTLTDLLVTYLNGISVKNDIVDTYIAQLSPELYAMIVNGVQLTKAKLTASVKLNGDALDTVTIKGELSHDYTGDTEGLTFLGDNDYVFTLTLNVEEISDEAEPIEFGYSDELAAYGVIIPTAVVYDVTGDVNIYVELVGTDPEITIDYEGVSFDKAKSCLVLKPSVFADAEYGDEIVIPIAMNAEEWAFEGGVCIYYMPEDVETLKSVITDMVMNMFGGIIGGEPDFPEDDWGNDWGDGWDNEDPDDNWGYGYPDDDDQYGEYAA